MSTTIEDKIALFTKILLERIEHEFEEKRQRLIEEYERQEKELQEEFQQKRKAALDEAVKQATLKKSQMESKAASECRLMLIKKRQEFIDRIVEKAKERARESLETEAYSDFLEKVLEQVTEQLAEEDEIVYVLTRHDISKFRAKITERLTRLRQGKAFRLEEGSDEMIGGVFAKTKEDHIQIDCTLASGIEDSRQLIGQLLAEKLYREEETDGEIR